MPITLDLPAELEDRLRQEAARRGVPAETYALQVLAQHLPPADRAAAAEAWFRLWVAEAEKATPEDEAEAEAFFKALDEDRPSYRKLFPDELKGITW